MTDQWTKSSFSGGNGGNCVEVRDTGDEVQVRNSRRPSGSVLTFTHAEWEAFLAGVLHGEFTSIHE